MRSGSTSESSVCVINVPIIPFLLNLYSAALASGNRVAFEDLPDEIRQTSPRPLATKGKVRPLEDIEKEYILAALKLNSGNQALTSQQLHIGKATLYRKLRRYGLLGKKYALAS